MPLNDPIPPDVRIVEQDGIVFEIQITGAHSEMTFITEMTRDGDALILNGLHIDGPGAGSSSIHELREAARELGRQQGARTVIIHGARRTTGAKPGKIPRPIVISVGD